MNEMVFTIGNRRTFLIAGYRQLPDLLSAIAGPFWEGWLRCLACFSQKESVLFSLTKRLSKPYLLKQRVAGYRPPAGTRKLNVSSGPAERSIATVQLKKKERLLQIAVRVGDHQKSPPPFRQQVASRAPNDRRQGRTKGERSAIGNRPRLGWGQPKSPLRPRGRASPATAATGGLPTGWHSFPRDRRSA
jgi:hypothetical protein